MLERHGDDTSNPSEEGHAREDGTGPVPGPRAPACDPGQPSRLCPREAAEDSIERATLDEREMQYLYQDGDDYYFMDTSSYEQIHINSEALGESVNYLKPEMTINVEFYGSEPVGIELPQTVDLKVLETVPGIKGATASNQVKPATLETGLVVQVPPFINTGDVVRVDRKSTRLNSS